MSKTKVAITGATGMLGAITLDSFVDSGEFELIATVRDQTKLDKMKAVYPNVEFRLLDAQVATKDDIMDAINDAAWVVNAIGIIKPYIHEDNPDETERAIRVNALFPELLAQAAGAINAKVIQIATDCVYSGEKGSYTESDLQDALDVYGKTKSLGETYKKNVFHLRCSIIGPELENHLSLMDWFLGQPEGAELNGFTNHQWNGVTTLQYAKICQGIISNNIVLPHVQHVVPDNLITKADLLRAFAKEYKRDDITINDVEAPKVIDRTLSTSNENLNSEIWNAAGYDNTPAIEDMIHETAIYNWPSKVNL